MDWSIWGDIANVLATGLAAFSIYLTVKEQKENRKIENSKRILDEKLHWYNEVVLNDLLKGLNSFIETSERNIELCKNNKDGTKLDEQLKKLFELIKAEQRVVGEKMYIINVFSPKLYKECYDLLQDIFDIYSEVINSSLGKRHLAYVPMNKVYKDKIKIVEKLYHYAGSFASEDL